MINQSSPNLTVDAGEKSNTELLNSPDPTSEADLCEKCSNELENKESYIYTIPTCKDTKRNALN